MYSTGGLQLCITNQQAILSRYNFNSWETMSKFRELLPADSRVEFRAVMEEGKMVARTSLQAAWVVADSATRTMSSAIAIGGCFRRSSHPPEVQQTMQYLLFEGVMLFLEQTDSRLHNVKDSRAT